MQDQSEPTHNTGVMNTGSGTVNISQSAVGSGATVYAGARPDPGGKNKSKENNSRADVGIITVLSEETSALLDALAMVGSPRRRILENGWRCYEADVDVEGSRMRVVATQTLDRGQRPMIIAVQRLQRYYAPGVVVLVGIAGGIHAKVGIGDVVIVQEVIYYDMRKETSAGILRRGQSRPVPSAIRHAINDFFSSNGEPYRTSIVHPGGESRDCSVWPGPIGSGEAVIADADSSIRRYIADFNDRTLALETEAGGLAEAFYEMAGEGAAEHGWLAVRGISDYADAGMDNTYHQVASWHAAVVLLRLLPYLRPSPGSWADVSP
jgi:adenosylhomocysteine nucleosidase